MNKLSIILLVIIFMGLTYYVLLKKKIFDYSNTANTITNDISTKAPINETSNIIVNIKNSSFNPQKTTIKKGTKITWKNDDKFPHTITSNEEGLFNSSSISYGESFSYIFNDTGSINYHCDFHPNMKGVVIVE